MLTTPRTSVLQSLRPHVRPALRAVAAGWQPAAVWLFWLAAVAWTAIFVLRHGYNLPAYDEWAFVKISFGSLSEQFNWLGVRHMEHRFPLARVLYLGILHATGHDYRIAMRVTVGFLAGTAAFLILAARVLRGRTVVADAIFPILFLHGAHTENLLMGYQIVFTLTVLALGVFALVVARSQDLRPGKSALYGAVCLFVVANGGWLGLVFVPCMGLWVAFRAWRALRTPGERVRGVAATLIGIAVLAYLAWSSWVLLEVMKDGKQRAEALGLDARIRAVAEVIGIGLGCGVGTSVAGVGTAGKVLLGVQLLTAVGLLAVAWRRPTERTTALGLLAVLVGVWVFAVGIGYSRGSGFASRYTTFTALGAAVPFLFLARYARWSAWPMAVLVIAAGVFLLPRNTRHAAAQGKVLDQRYADFRADCRTGMPMDVLADRHIDFWLRTKEGWMQLWEAGFPLLSKVGPPAEHRQMVPLARTRDGQLPFESYQMNRYKVDFDGVKHVSFVRVKFAPKAMSTWEPLAFRWTDPTTGQPRQSLVRLWIRQIDMETAFWIDGPIAAGDLLIGRPDCGVKILSIEYEAKPAQ